MLHCEYLSVAQVAARWGVTPQTVRYFVAANRERLDLVNRGRGGKLWIRLASLKEFEAAGLVPRGKNVRS